MSGQYLGPHLLRIAELEEQLAQHRIAPVMHIERSPPKPEDNAGTGGGHARGIGAAIIAVLKRAGDAGMGLQEIRAALPAWPAKRIPTNLSQLVHTGAVKASGKAWHKTYRLAGRRK